MIKIWGRNTSSNVQKAMWGVGELGLEHTRIDVGGAFGKNREPAYLAMNPNGLVPTLEEEDGFLLWESNSIVRYLAGKHDKNNVLEPKDAKQRALAMMSPYGSAEKQAMLEAPDLKTRAEILVCPLTKGPLEYDAAKQELISRSAKLAYPIRDGIPIMLPEEARRLD